MKILINDQEVVFKKEDFPMFVNGEAFVQSGASFFSVSLMSKLLEWGEKIVFFTGFDPAKELFRNQIGDIENDSIIIIPTGDEEEFIQKLDTINDLNERIILFKNIEEYSLKLFEKLKNQELIIFSGDIDKCKFGDELSKIDFKTKIFFSYPKKVEVENKIELPKYNGLVISSKYNGLVSLEGI